MKKIIISLVALLIIVGGSITAVELNAFSLYKDQDHAQYDEVLDADEPTVYYYYQTTCGFCNSIKNQVQDFAQIINQTEGISFKLVDMKDTKNMSAWYDWDTHNKEYGKGTSPDVNPDYISNPTEMKSIDDIKITGTPTAIYVKDHQVVNYDVGENLFNTFEAVNQEFNLGYEFDPSKYGE